MFPRWLNSTQVWKLLNAKTMWNEKKSVILPKRAYSVNVHTCWKHLFYRIQNNEIMSIKNENNLLTSFNCVNFHNNNNNKKKNPTPFKQHQMHRKMSKKVKLHRFTYIYDFYRFYYKQVYKNNKNLHTS